MDPETLASALADAVIELLPEGFSATAVGSEILLEGPIGGYGGGDLVVDVAANMVGRQDEFNAARDASERFLSDLQDFVAEATTEPWPSTGRGPMPLPMAFLEGGLLRIAYGDRTGKSFELAAIPLSPE